jgi:Ca-activated chloride channel family protein
MGEGFEYMVTPLVFDLELTMSSDKYKIEKVYGSPESNEATGEIMKVSTLFPSDRKNQQTRGGLILMELKKVENAASDNLSGENQQIKLSVSYQDRKGNQMSNEAIIEDFAEDSSDYYDNSGIRKGILLARYVSLIKSWLLDTSSEVDGQVRVQEYIVNQQEGIPADVSVFTSKWERQSSPLKVSAHYQELFRDFKDYFESEMTEIEDDELEREVEVLETLSTY